MKVLKNDKWKQHPWSLNKMTVNVDVNFLKSISNKNSTDFTDLLTGEIVHQDVVWEDIEKNGLNEPLLIVIGYKNKTIRLESGNHRIKTAIQSGYTHLPVSIIVIQENLLSKVNGEHFFNAISIVNWDNVIRCVYPYQINPRKVLSSDLILE